MSRVSGIRESALGWSVEISSTTCLGFFEGSIFLAVSKNWARLAARSFPPTSRSCSIGIGVRCSERIMRSYLRRPRANTVFTRGLYFASSSCARIFNSLIAFAFVRSTSRRTATDAFPRCSGSSRSYASTIPRAAISAIS